MGKIRRKFSREFKISLLRELEAGTSVAEVTRRAEIHPSLLARWKKEFSENPEHAFRGQGTVLRKVENRKYFQPDIPCILGMHGWVILLKTS